ncbi:hypothetical protein Uis1B_2198 [Bifidobacterium margollesii]|uniref:Uncharacterized protein n=1 Tax=Bifidobacterium margollesii TaxID=2020964 RepID=A0A2N5J6Y3_9BIFI|nr:hypothetical protein [Bifidobacterium margollesii]PLS29964.1 hypothetical protein Uis1B_2198 [Bifidobacterium margollesii]
MTCPVTILPVFMRNSTICSLPLRDGFPGSRSSAAHTRNAELCGFSVRGRRRTGIIALGFLICAVATAGRLLMSCTLHMWYAYNQRADDQLLMMQSLPGYFDSTDLYKLAKNQGYGYVLRFIGWSGVNVDLWYFAVWLLAALLCAVAVQRCFHMVGLSMFAYVYVLWNPLAFEDWLGTRVYRNSLFAPVLFILVAGLLIFLTMVWGLIRSLNVDIVPSRSGRTVEADRTVEAGESVKVDRTVGAGKSVESGNSVEADHAGETEAIILLKMAGIVVFAALLGAWFALVFDLKEDSIWMVPMVGFALALAAAPVLRARLSENVLVSVTTKIGVVALCVLPAMVTVAIVGCIEDANNRHFGVRELNTRTSGELAGFISRIYGIDSPNQTVEVWSPADSIEKAFDSAPSLRAYPQIREYMEQFQGEDQLTGDFISWRMLDAIDQSPLTMRDEAEVQRVFAKANAELDRAFAEGRLRKTDKIAISASLVPRTPDEIGELFAPSRDAYANTVTLDGNYAIGSESLDFYYSGRVHAPSRMAGLKQLNLDIDDLSPQAVPWFTRADAETVAWQVVAAYRAINLAMIAVAVAAVVSSVSVALVRAVRRGSVVRGVSAVRGGSAWSSLGWLGLAACLLAYAYCYGFFAYWYAQYLHNDRITFFYVTGLIAPLIDIGLLLAVGAYLRLFAGGRCD